jgi:hypothetical protein
MKAIYEYERLHVNEKWIYTLRRKSDMGVFYVGMCKIPQNRVTVHKHGNREVSQRIRELYKLGDDAVTVFEERILPDHELRAEDVERDYIEGYSRLIGDQLTNVFKNPNKLSKKPNPFTTAGD